VKRISIIGSGFGGLSAIRELRKRDATAQLTLIAPRAELHDLPGIIWIPSGLRKREDLTVPLERFLQRLRVRFFAAEATGLSADGRTVTTTQGNVENDGLIIASGGRFLKKLPGIEHAITPCEGISAAEQVRDRLAAMSGGVIACGFAGNPAEPNAMRGGPMFEFLFGIERQLRREKRRQSFEMVFFSPGTEPGSRFGPKAVGVLLSEMQRRNIHTQLGNKLLRFEPDKVVTEGGEFAADLILFMPGMTGNAWFDNTNLPRSPGGLLKADKHCRVEGRERVYVAGDSGSFEGPEWMPKQAHMAGLQAVAAAGNLLSEMRGDPPTEVFRTELFCLIDAQDRAMLVRRTTRRSLIVPNLRAFHRAKRGFEHMYLRGYR
jgi:sulfide:quinone oxidoreductase